MSRKDKYKATIKTISTPTPRRYTRTKYPPVFAPRTTITTWSTVHVSVPPGSYRETTEKLVMDVIFDSAKSIHPVGSRETCVPAPTDTDEDYLILTAYKWPFVKECVRMGFDMETKDYTDEGVRSLEDPIFISVRHGDLNLIVTDDIEFHGKFLLATSVCKKLNVLKKKDRITVFQAILYGEDK